MSKFKVNCVLQRKRDKKSKNKLKFLILQPRARAETTQTYIIQILLLELNKSPQSRHKVLFWHLIDGCFGLLRVVKRPLRVSVLRLVACH